MRTPNSLLRTALGAGLGLMVVTMTAVSIAWACEIIRKEGVGLHRNLAEAEAAARLQCTANMTNACKTVLVDVKHESPDCEDSTVIRGNKKCEVTCSANCLCPPSLPVRPAGN